MSTKPASTEEVELIAAAIVDMPLDEFRTWAAEATTYPNCYQTSVDTAFERARRVIAVRPSPSDEDVEQVVRALRWLRAWWEPGSNHDTEEVKRGLAAADAALAAIAARKSEEPKP